MHTASAVGRRHSSPDSAGWKAQPAQCCAFTCQRIFWWFLLFFRNSSAYCIYFLYVYDIYICIYIYSYICMYTLQILFWFQRFFFKRGNWDPSSRTWLHWQRFRLHSPPVEPEEIPSSFCFQICWVRIIKAVAFQPFHILKLNFNKPSHLQYIAVPSSELSKHIVLPYLKSMLYLEVATNTKKHESMVISNAPENHGSLW